MNLDARVLHPAASCSLPVARWQEGRLAPGHEVVPDEVPVALVYNGISHAVMLASPQDLEDFALGFSLSEAIVRQASDVRDIDVSEADEGFVVAIDIAAGAMARLKASRRARTGRTGCGLCGIESLQHFAGELAADGEHARVTPAGTPLAPAALHRAMSAMHAQQHLHHATGGAHAAGWADRDGNVLVVREDVGRHNALDKLVGALARAGCDNGAGFAVITSRASYEMVQKAARAGIGLLAAISAPTAMAVRIADAAGVTLAGFVRDGRHVLYTHAQRLGA